MTVKVRLTMKRTRAIRLAKANDQQIRRAIAARDFPRLLRHKVQRLFPKAPVQTRALTLLEQYGRDANEPEAARVRLAILRLAGSDMQEITVTVEGAKEDYEDIIAWAEFPAETEARLANRRLKSTELSKIRDDDKQQYDDWLAVDG